MYLPKRWAKVKLNRRKIIENYFKSSESSPQMRFSQKMNTSERPLLEFLWGIVSRKMVNWQKSNGDHFQMFKQQFPQRGSSKKVFVFFEEHFWRYAFVVSQERYMARRALLFLLSSQKNSLLFYKNLEKQSFVP